MGKYKIILNLHDGKLLIRDMVADKIEVIRKNGIKTVIDVGYYTFVLELRNGDILFLNSSFIKLYDHNSLKKFAQSIELSSRVYQHALELKDSRILISDEFYYEIRDKHLQVLNRVCRCQLFCCVEIEPNIILGNIAGKLLCTIDLENAPGMWCQSNFRRENARKMMLMDDGTLVVQSPTKTRFLRGKEQIVKLPWSQVLFIKIGTNEVGLFQEDGATTVNTNGTITKYPIPEGFVGELFVFD